MKRLTFSCFSEKAVVNCRDGRIMGYPYDLRFDADSGNILSFFVKESGKLCFFSKPNTAEIPWERITKIGDDIIQGKVPVYYLKTDNVNISIQKSNEFAFLYTRKKQISNISQKKLNEHPIIQEAYRQRQTSIIDKISKIADNIVNNDIKQSKTTWQENEQITDKTKLAEKKMYNEWSL